MAADADAIFNEEDDFAAWAAYCKAETRGEEEKAEDGGKKMGKVMAKVGARALNGFSSDTGLRNRRFRRASEFHPGPKYPQGDWP